AARQCEQQRAPAGRPPRHTYLQASVAPLPLNAHARSGPAKVARPPCPAAPSTNTPCSGSVVPVASYAPFLPVTLKTTSPGVPMFFLTLTFVMPTTPAGFRYVHAVPDPLTFHPVRVNAS